MEQMEDPYGLSGEEERREPLTAREIVEEERAKIKGRGNLKILLTTSSAFLSPYRLGGYLLLTIALLWLMGRGLFRPTPFLIGLGILPGAALLSTLFRRDQSSI